MVVLFTVPIRAEKLLCGKGLPPPLPARALNGAASTALAISASREKTDENNVTVVSAFPCTVGGSEGWEISEKRGPTIGEVALAAAGLAGVRASTEGLRGVTTESRPLRLVFVGEPEDPSAALAKVGGLPLVLALMAGWLVSALGTAEVSIERGFFAPPSASAETPPMAIAARITFFAFAANAARFTFSSANVEGNLYTKPGSHLLATTLWPIGSSGSTTGEPTLLPLLANHSFLALLLLLMEDAAAEAKVKLATEWWRLYRSFRCSIELLPTVRLLLFRSRKDSVLGTGTKVERNCFGAAVAALGPAEAEEGIAAEFLTVLVGCCCCCAACCLLPPRAILLLGETVPLCSPWFGFRTSPAGDFVGLRIAPPLPPPKWAPFLPLLLLGERSDEGVWRALLVSDDGLVALPVTMGLLYNR